MSCAASMNRTPAAQAAFDAEGEQARGAGHAVDLAHLARDQRVLRMLGQARVADPADLRMRCEEARDGERVAQCRSIRSGSVSTPCSICQALIGESAAP